MKAESRSALMDFGEQSLMISGATTTPLWSAANLVTTQTVSLLLLIAMCVTSLSSCLR